MNDPMQHLVTNLSIQIAQRKQELKDQAISNYLGSRVWTYVDVEPRCESVQCCEGVELFKMDGKTIVEFHGLNHKTQERGRALMFEVDVSYRMIQPNEEKINAC